MAVSNYPLGLGAVHRVELEAIYPVFVPSSRFSTTYGRTAEAGGELLADLVFSGNPRLSQIVRLAGAASESVSGVYEDRYEGGICQYFVRTGDPELIAYSRDQGSDEDDDVLRALEDELDDLDNDGYDLRRQYEDASYEAENSADLLKEFLETRNESDGPTADEIERQLRDQARTSRERLDALQKVLDAYEHRIAFLERKLGAPKPGEIAVVGINNPCRNFQIGETLLAVSIDQGQEFVLQPVYQ